MSAFIPSSLYGVIGWPLAQSLSPLLHNTAFQALGIPAAYMLWELPPEKLPRFVDSMRLLGIRGCSVTLPHKVEILPLLDHRSERVELMGAANTLYWRDDRLCGENTDVTGFMHPLLERGLDPATPVLVLGAGGAARAVVCGLWLHGCRRIFVTTPSDRSHAPLVERFGGKVPDNMEDLLSLPGVGRKTANLILGDIYGKDGYVCDTHCIRITGRLGLTDGSKDPLKVEQQLRKVIPPEEANNFCHRMVLHGRALCMARKPDCGDCSLRPLCDHGSGK